jgi:hypothetical protein
LIVSNDSSKDRRNFVMGTSLFLPIAIGIIIGKSKILFLRPRSAGKFIKAIASVYL